MMVDGMMIKFSRVGSRDYWQAQREGDIHMKGTAEKMGPMFIIHEEIMKRSLEFGQRMGRYGGLVTSDSIADCCRCAHACALFTRPCACA